MPRKLFRKKFIFVTILALFTLISIYFLFYQSFNDYDEFIVVKAVEPYDDDEISLSNLVNFAHFQYKIKPDSLCNNFEDDLLGKDAIKKFLNRILFYMLISIVRCYYCNILCWS